MNMAYVNKYFTVGYAAVMYFVLKGRKRNL
jgi:hypothetical protein